MKTVLFITLLAATVVVAEETTENGHCKDGKDEYCAQCTSDKCTTCYASSLQTEAGQCKAVDPAVENCTTYKADSTECQGCMMEYWLGSGKCNKVDIDGCTVQSDASTCLLCDGKFVKDGKCDGDACSTLDANCEQCSMSGETKVCLSCKSGYKTKSDSSGCEEGTVEDNTKDTGEGCMRNTEGVCKTCNYGYYVNSASSADKMTCAKSTRYSGVAVLKSIALALFAFALF